MGKRLFRYHLKPARYCTFSETTVALVQDQGTGLWTVLTCKNNALTPFDRQRKVAEAAYWEKCDDLARTERERLLEEVTTPENMEKEGHVGRVLELGRLELRDDGQFHQVMEAADEFCALHNDDEIREHCDQALAAYRERRAARQSEKE